MWRQQKKVAESVPIVLAGHLDIDEHGGGPVLPPITNDWLSDFWFTSLKHMREIAQPALVQANVHRLKKKKTSQKKIVRNQHMNSLLPFSIEWIPLLGTLGFLIGGMLGTISCSA